MPINNPRDIPGLIAWYSADNMALHYTNGQSMDRWIDLSGSHYHATGVGTYPLWQSNTGPAGGPAIRFAGNGYFSIAGSPFSSATAAEAMIKIKADDTGPRGFWTIGSQGNGSHYPFSGVVYDNFGSSSTRNSFTPTLSITSWRRYNVWSATNDWAASLDGVSQATNGTNTVGFHNIPALGYSTQASYFFLGHQSVLVFYDHKLTGTERTDLETWMEANPSGGTITTFDDAFANAPALPTVHKITGVDTTAWTTEASEPGAVFNTAWAKVTPNANDTYTFDTIGSNYDTVLSLYTGTALNNLVLVASDDDSGGSSTSKLTAALSASTTYYIQVGSKAPGGGSLSFSMSPKPDSQLSSIAMEAAMSGTAERRLAAISTEMATGPSTAPERRLGSVVIEVAVPSRLGHRGWGPPVKNSTWS